MQYKEIICDCAVRERCKPEYKSGAFKFKDGYYEIYYLDGKEFRDDGPVSICYHDNGKISHELYRVNYINHRTDGPAEIFYNEDGDIGEEEFWLNGVQYSEEEYYKQLATKLYW